MAHHQMKTASFRALTLREEHGTQRGRRGWAVETEGMWPTAGQELCRGTRSTPDTEVFCVCVSAGNH